MIDDIIAWILNPAHHAILAMLGTGVAALIGGAWAVFTYFAPRKSLVPPQMPGPAEVSLGTIQGNTVIIQFATNSGQFATPKSQIELDRMLSAIHRHRDSTDGKLSSLRDQVRHWHRRWTESKLNTESVKEVMKVAQSINADSQYGAPLPRTLCADLSVFDQFINCGSERHRGDISSAFSFYLLALNPAKRIELLPSQAPSLSALVGHYLSQPDNELRFIDQIDRLSRIRKLMRQLAQTKEFAPSDDVELQVVSGRIFQKLERAWPRRMRPPKIVEANSIACVINYNKRAFSSGLGQFAVYATTNDTLPSAINSQPELYRRGVDDLLIPHPICHVYEAAWRAFALSRSSESDLSAIWHAGLSAHVILSISRMTRNGLMRDLKHLTYLRETVDQLLPLIDPFHQHVAQIIERERVDRISELRTWEQKLREGKQVLNEVVMSHIDWLTKEEPLSFFHDGMASNDVGQKPASDGT